MSAMKPAPSRATLVLVMERDCNKRQPAGDRTMPRNKFRAPPRDKSSPLKNPPESRRVDWSCPLFGALIDPGADQADLFLGQRRIFVALFRGWHFHVFDQLGNVSDHRAFGAVAGDNGRIAAFAALDGGVEAV